MIDYPILTHTNLYKIEDFLMSKDTDKLYSYTKSLQTQSTDWCIMSRTRSEFVYYVSWAMPDSNVISAITEFSTDKTIVEIAAGHGYWAALLRHGPNKVIATDNFSQTEQKTFTEVLNMDADSATTTFLSPDKAPNSVLMLVWPPYIDSLAENALQSFRKNGGTQLIYVGEINGGCTADSQFFDELSKNWAMVQIINIPRWNGIDDYCYFYKLKINTE